jgi:hypothetical protein
MAKEHNPFASAGSDDPFNDPSVKNVSAFSSDGYNNPFEAPNPNQPLGSGRMSAYEPPKQKKSVALSNSESTELKPTQYKASRPSSAGLSEDELVMREQALVRRETAIAEKEKDLEDREKRLGPYGKYKPPNWPCECYPIAYHNISEEIPEQHRVLMRKYYAAVLWTWLSIFWNWICFITIWGTPNNGSESASSDALWSSIYVFVGIPGAWKLWYRPVYYAVKDGKNRNWVLFFIFYLAHMIFSILMALGVPSCAGSGLFVMIKFFSASQNLIGFFCLISVGLWGLGFLFALYLSKKGHSTWRKMGGEEELRKEMAQGVVKATLNSAVASDAENI